MKVTLHLGSSIVTLECLEEVSKEQCVGQFRQDSLFIIHVVFRFHSF
jgi:hypothetical protein